MKGSILGRSCYRVTDSSSISPYSEEYGFTANNPMFTDGAGRPISGRTFMSGIDKPSMEDADLLESVVDHILGGWSTYYPSYQSSQWIFTTKSLDWAMWETARRLASGQVSWVSLAKIIRMIHTHGTIGVLARLEWMLSTCLKGWVSVIATGAWFWQSRAQNAFTTAGYFQRY